METTAKRINISFKKEDLRQLKTLCDMFEETPTMVIRRAIQLLYRECFKEKKDAR